MTTQFPKPEIRGTRTGYVIRFTCPLCAVENIIVNKTPRDHFKESRDASCRACRKRFSITTPNGVAKPASHPVPQAITSPEIP
jgi:transcription elongation factor Elf1